LFKESVLIEDVVSITRQMLPLAVQEMAEKIIKLLIVSNAIIAPLVVDDSVIGMLSVQASDLSEMDIPAIRAFANQLAMAINQARLFEQAQKEISERKIAQERLQDKLDELTLINLITSIGTEELDEETLIRQAVEAVSTHFQMTSVGILILDEVGNVAYLEMASDVNVDEDILQTIFSGGGIVGSVIESGKVIRLENVSKNKAYNSWNPAIKSVLCVPIKINHQVLGVIKLESDQSGAFNVEDEGLLITLSNQLATAIGRIRSFDGITRKSQELEALYNIALAINEELDTSILLTRLYEQIDAYLSPDVFGVALYDAEKGELHLEVAMEHGKPVKDLAGDRWTLDQAGLTGWVVRNQKSLYIPNLQHEDSLPVEPKHSGKPVTTWMGVP
jgi:GAF domain-containing protein